MFAAAGDYLIILTKKEGKMKERGRRKRRERGKKGKEGKEKEGKEEGIVTSLKLTLPAIYLIPFSRPNQI